MTPRRRPCRLCEDKIPVDYKQPEVIGRFLTDRGKILPRRASRTCAKHQRQLARAIKRARFLALLPYIGE